MNKETALAVFEDYKIRRFYDEKNEFWYFSIIDEDGLELSTICRQLKLQAPDGKMIED